MIYITGDIHGSPERLGVHSFYEQKEMTRDDVVIICGDFGMVWEESGESASERYWLKWLEDKPFTTVFVCGNHENFDRLYQYPVKEWHGGKVHEIRPEVPEAVAKMHGAGVQVMMVTGDVIDTAKAIAKDAGLITSESDIAMSAIDFDALSDEEAKAKLPYIKVIARATPNTKLRIVRLAQELGLCVGMTGDGTNDAPALKAADVGFSMGSGTDVCKEAGDIIITDDNFVSITDAVLLGRTFMHNVMKFLKFQLPINVGLVILSILYPIIMAVEAVAAVQILVINIVMDSLNSLSFGGEPAKDEYMKEKPIPKGSKLLSRETIGQIAVSVVAFIGIFGITLLPPIQKVFGSDETVYATVRFALLVMMATFNGFNIRTDGFNLFKGIKKNKLFVEIAVAIFALTFILAQFGGAIMGCTALTATQWGVTVGLAFMIIPIDLARKAIVKVRRK